VTRPSTRASPTVPPPVGHDQDEERLQGAVVLGDVFESLLAVSDPLVQQRDQLVALLPGERPPLDLELELRHRADTVGQVSDPVHHCSSRLGR
jgi:hypothetical protein